MARSKKKGAAAPESEPLKPSEVQRVISQKKLRALMASHRTAREEVSEVSGGLGTEVKNAVKNDYLNAPVFRLIMQLDRKTPEKLRDFLDDLQHYLDISGLEKRAQDVQPLDLRDRNGSGEEEGDAEGDQSGEGMPAGASAH